MDNDATDHLTARETIWMHLHLDGPITMDKLRKAVKAANIGKRLVWMAYQLKS